MREWIADTSSEESTYLIRVDRDGECFGWQRASLSGVIDALADNAYAEQVHGEDADTLTVFILTDFGAAPVRITQVAEGDQVWITAAYRVPGVRGKAAWVTSGRGAYRRIEA